MEFRIADTFTASLAKLTNAGRTVAKTTAFDLQANPDQPGFSYHQLSKSKDPNFRSVRVNLDIRIIVHRTADSLMLCYVDHHDDAYQWAGRRKLETHPTTGAAQFVEVRETVQGIVTQVYVAGEPQTVSKPPVLGGIADEQLLKYGVPPEWLDDVKGSTEDTLLYIADHLPGEASEALLELATGGIPLAARLSPVVTPSEDQYLAQEAVPIMVDRFDPSSTDPFEHPDAMRRFRIMRDVDELQRALEYPWDQWAVFLHPAQRDMVERDFNGPARVSGSAGTGKTVVPLHRAVHLARANPDARVLLTTFSDTLANALWAKLRILISSEPRLGERIEVCSLDSVGRRLYSANFGPVSIASDDDQAQLIADAAKAHDSGFSPPFLVSEWRQVVDAWQLETWEEFRDVARLGRRHRLPGARRQALWPVFAHMRQALQEQGQLTLSGMYGRLTSEFAPSEHGPYDFVVVDESQDLGVVQLRVLAALVGNKPNGLFFAGDLGQRIFQQPFSWRELGVDVRGRSRTLRINYRTSHQIRSRADLLLDPQIADVDGNVEERRGTVSVFNGPDPVVLKVDTEAAEMTAVSDWLAYRTDEGVSPVEMSVFVRSPVELNRAMEAVEKAGLAANLLSDQMGSQEGNVSVSTMHLAKGLEFRVVAVMACDDEVIPLQSRIESAAEDAELEEVYNTERHLLYVACTRARDHLLVAGVRPASEFLDDLRA